MKQYIKTLWARITSGNPDIVIHGFQNPNNPFWKEKEERERIEYAFRNPWVLKYDFGHLKLIEKYYHKII